MKIITEYSQSNGKIKYHYKDMVRKYELPRKYVDVEEVIMHQTVHHPNWSVDQSILNMYITYVQRTAIYCRRIRVYEENALRTRRRR
jgi:hypothetical protein